MRRKSERTAVAVWR